jgi:hypothetical protein
MVIGTIVYHDQRESQPVLTRNHRQEVMSRAYVQAIAGRCGLACSLRDFDYGIDLTLHDIRRRGHRHMESGFKLDIQAKSTTTRNLTDTDVVYDLDVKNYDDLRDPQVGCPRVLVLLVLPEDEDQWTEQTEGHLLLRHAAYWLSLKGQGPTRNQKTVRVLLARANLFSVQTLEMLMDKVRRREPL